MVFPFFIYSSDDDLEQAECKDSFGCVLCYVTCNWQIFSVSFYQYV